MSSPRQPPTPQEIETARRRKVLRAANVDQVEALTPTVASVLEQIQDAPTSSPMLSPNSALAPRNRQNALEELLGEIRTIDRTIEDNPERARLPVTFRRDEPLQLLRGEQAGTPAIPRTRSNPEGGGLLTGLLRSAMSSADRGRSFRPGLIDVRAALRNRLGGRTVVGAR